MKKTILAVAVILGVSVTGFSQGKALVGVAKASTLKVIKLEVADENGGIIEVETVIENDNVTVVLGETIIIHTDGTNKVIAVKGNGEFVGYISENGNAGDRMTRQ